MSSLVLWLAAHSLAAAPAEQSPPALPPGLPSTPVQSPSPASSAPAAIENSVVKVFATLRPPDPSRPWTKQEPNEITASGTVITGKRILTNAHVVQYASEIQVQANQAGDKLAATLEAVGPGTDLAVLRLQDDKFFDSHPPLPFKKALPDSKEPVMVYGYPTGGSSLSITKGIISRIEFTGYSLSGHGLRIQIDAAINPGNSGGPAIVNDEIVGIAFSHLHTAQNIGYIIPVEEIELFLQDIADGHYDGKPAMYDDLQTLENPALRIFLHLPDTVRGMIVHRPLDSDPSYPLKEWDVITKIGTTPVDDQGMVKITDTLRVRFQYLIQKMSVSNAVPLTVFRAGKELTVNLPLLKERPLVMPELKGSYPPYFIYGPLVFSEATAELIAGLSRNREAAAIMAGLTYAGNPIITRMGDKPLFPGERLVVIPAPFFPNPVAKGYGNPTMQVVKSVNRKPVKNLASLVEILRDVNDDYVSFEFNVRAGGETTVFPRAQMNAATDSILTDSGIRSQGSPEIMKIWQAKPPG
jgi:S1-C subfamily serine protease